MLNQTIEAYAGLGHHATHDKLKQDLQDPLFLMAVTATFGPMKYFISAGKMEKILRDYAPGDEPLTTDSAVWQVLLLLAGRSVTGNAAIDMLMGELQRLDADAREVVLKILDKTWRVGVTADAVNHARPGTFRPAKFMLAHNIEDRLQKGKVTWPMLGTYKYDGYRAIYCQDTRRALSRNGNQFALRPELVQAIHELAAHLRAAYGLEYLPAIDGELFSGSWKATAEDRPNGYGKMIVFGMLPSEMIYGGTSESFEVEEFLECVDQFVKGSACAEWLDTPKRRLLRNEAEMEEMFQESLAEGFEGLVLTSCVRPYEGKRSYHWLKRKPADPVDVVITDVILGDERSKNAGKVVGLQVRYNGKISGASGMTQETIDKCTELHASGHLVGLAAELVIHELTPDGMLRHGRVKAIRFDKPAEECE